MVNLKLRNKFQWNLNQNLYIFIQESAFENVCEMAAISSRAECVNKQVPDHKEHFLDTPHLERFLEDLQHPVSLKQRSS